MKETFRNVANLFIYNKPYFCNVALPLDDVGWSEVCCCGIFWSYSLFSLTFRAMLATNCLKYVQVVCTLSNVITLRYAQEK